MLNLREACYMSLSSPGLALTHMIDVGGMRHVACSKNSRTKKTLRKELEARERRGKVNKANSASACLVQESKCTRADTRVGSNEILAGRCEIRFSEMLTDASRIE